MIFHIHEQFLSAQQVFPTLWPRHRLALRIRMLLAAWATQELHRNRNTHTHTHAHTHACASRMDSAVSRAPRITPLKVCLDSVWKQQYGSWFHTRDQKIKRKLRLFLSQFCLFFSQFISHSLDFFSCNCKFISHNSFLAHIVQSHILNS